MKNDINKTVIAYFMLCLGSTVVFATLTGMMVRGVVDGVDHLNCIIAWAITFGAMTVAQFIVVCLSRDTVTDAFKAYKENKN